MTRHELKITTGMGNVAVGYYALRNNTEGERNTACGRRALYKNTSGLANTAVGASALEHLLDGDGHAVCGVIPGCGIVLQT